MKLLAEQLTEILHLEKSRTKLLQQLGCEFISSEHVGN